METSILEMNNFMNMHHVLLIYGLKSFSLVQSSHVENRYLYLFMFLSIFKSFHIILSCCLSQMLFIHLKLLNVTGPSLELFCVCLPHQWVSLGVALRHLLGRGSLLGWAVAVVSHVLRPQLEQRLALLLQWSGVPWIRVVHPLGWILPRCSFPVELHVWQTGKAGMNDRLNNQHYVVSYGQGLIAVQANLL